MVFRRQSRGAAFAAPCLFLALLLSSGFANAAAVDVNPVRVDLTRTGVSAELRIRNEDSTPVSMDVVAMQWTQSDLGEDRLVASDEILAVPPIFTVQPGEEQIVRVAMLGKTNPDAERTFRLLITELAPPEGTQGSGVTMRMQISMPVFVAPQAGSAAPDIQVQSVAKTDQGSYVSLRNDGNGHVKLQSVTITGSAGTFPGQGQKPAGQARYILPGATVGIMIPGEVGVPQRVEITSDRDGSWGHDVVYSE
jgi:fimbrial chaperone protein